MGAIAVVCGTQACNNSGPYCFVHSLGKALKLKNVLHTVDSRSHPDSDGGSIPPISTDIEVYVTLKNRHQAVF